MAATAWQHQRTCAGNFVRFLGKKKAGNISRFPHQNVGARGWRWGRPKPRAVPPRARLRVSRDLPGAMCRLGLPRARWVRSKPRRFHSALGSTPDFIPSIPSFQGLSSSRATGSLLLADGSNPRGAANPMKDDDLRPTKGTHSKILGTKGDAVPSKRKQPMAELAMQS